VDLVGIAERVFMCDVGNFGVGGLLRRRVRGRRRRWDGDLHLISTPGDTAVGHTFDASPMRRRVIVSWRSFGTPAKSVLGLY
jgi:hypothetical protein